MPKTEDDPGSYLCSIDLVAKNSYSIGQVAKLLIHLFAMKYCADGSSFSDCELLF